MDRAFGTGKKSIAWKLFLGLVAGVPQQVEQRCKENYESDMKRWQMMSGQPTETLAPQTETKEVGCGAWGCRTTVENRPAQGVELSLYDSSGVAVAYLTYDATIYSWLIGAPVAYLVDGHVYGFNGRHLGWYEDGVLISNEGTRCGFTAQKLQVQAQQFPPLKGMKEILPFKNYRDYPPTEPPIYQGGQCSLQRFLDQMPQRHNDY